MDRQTALHFGVGLAFFSVLLMGVATNWLAAAILAVSILFYVFVYTIWLKRRTPQNIVIGGAAGAFPPLIGWAAATGDVAALPILLFALIFLWTPPHFWALSLFVRTRLCRGRRADAAGRRRREGDPDPDPALHPADGGRGGRALAARPRRRRSTASPPPRSASPSSCSRCGCSPTRRPSRPAMKPEKRLFAFSILYLFALFGALVARPLAVA